MAESPRQGSVVEGPLATGAPPNTAAELSRAGDRLGDYLLDFISIQIIESREKEVIVIPIMRPVT